MSKKIEIPDNITVKELADKLSIPVTQLIAELFKNGVMTTVNEAIDFDTAEIIVSEMDVDVELVKESDEQSDEQAPKEKRVHSKNAKQRPPIVAMMGHVDHGKTSLMDAIRNADVAEHEAGGITQHISAFQVKHNDRAITLLDTPGHEAFGALRQHGARLTDLVVIVVAADDGVKPQTIEAIKFANNAGVKMIVALNKIDKSDANENLVKQQLSDNGVVIEEWGGETVIMPVSAKTKQGLPELLDMILLVADVEELKADYDVPATGLVIESHLEKGRGPIPTILVEEGILRKGDNIVIGTTHGKIRSLQATDGKELAEAGPSTPAIITGLKDMPEFGDKFEVVKSEKEARTSAETVQRSQSQENRSGVSTSGELMKMISKHRDTEELAIIAKADVKGSLTSVIDSLKSINTDEVSVRVISSAVGPVNDNDLHLAKSSGAIIYGFNAQTPNNIHQAALRDNVEIRLFKVIYELIDDVKKQMSTLLAPEVIETDLGRLIVKGVFKTTKTDVICGGEVTKGKLTQPALARISRDGKELGQAELIGIKKGPQEVKEATVGDMCGLQLKTQNKIELIEGDHIDLFSRQTRERTL
ncbi:MAG TPA: translation initiation factor IF-2 [Candidatus Saccharibacteria bacterium]|nr:translation initiation factor IF-2 [Candidatus Saccharibacteria bacterium]